MTVSKNRKQVSLENEGKEVRKARRGDTRVSTMVYVRGVGKKTTATKPKRNQTGGGVKKDDTRVSTMIDVRGASKKKEAHNAESKTAKSSKVKKDRTRVSTILDVRAVGKKAASSRRTHSARDGK